ncbi:hypothetical protein GCM10009664_13420 [Kitasatospora gansuensis]
MAMVRPTPASMPCTTAGETASADLATRKVPSSSCRSPAATVTAQVTCQPNWAIRPATITVSAAEGPVTWSGAPPRAPATMPPTAAATSPEVSGAPVASAMPSENGTAIRKTTREAGKSLVSRPRRPGGAWSVVSEAMGAAETSRVMVSRLSGGTNAVRSGRCFGGSDRLSWVATVWRGMVVGCRHGGVGSSTPGTIKIR